MHCYCSTSEWKHLVQNDLALSWAWSRVSSHAASEHFGFNFPHRHDLLDPLSLCCTALHLLRDSSTCNHPVLPNVEFLQFLHLIQELQIPPRQQRVTEKSWCPLLTASTQASGCSGEELCSVASLFPSPRCRPSLASYTQTLGFLYTNNTISAQIFSVWL